eukprot:COSAG01_NODE_6047_length_3881_cov_3.726864_6_plen_178_part_00
MNREGLPARLPAQSPAGGGGCARHTLPARRGVQSPSVGCPHGRRPCWRWASMFCRGNPADAASARSDAAACSSSIGRIGTPCLLDLQIKSFWNARFPSGNVQSVRWLAGWEQNAVSLKKAQSSCFADSLAVTEIRSTLFSTVRCTYREYCVRTLVGSCLYKILLIQNLLSWPLSRKQ